MTEGLNSVAKGHQMNRIKKCQIDAAHSWWYRGFSSLSLLTILGLWYVSILIFAVKVLRKMHRPTKEANMKNYLSNVISTWYMKDNFETIITCLLRQGKTKKSGLTRNREIIPNLNQSFRGTKEAIAKPFLSITGFLYVATITQYSGMHRQDPEKSSQVSRGSNFKYPLHWT